MGGRNRRRARSGIIALSSAAFALTGLAAACMTFDGVVVPSAALDASKLPDTGTFAPADAAGLPDVRDGGTLPDVATMDACATSAAGYLTHAEAAKACQYIADCDTGQLELDIESNFGIVTSSTNYAYCVNALAGTVPNDRVGLDIAQQTFQCVARATSCIQARGYLAVESLTANDSRCAGSLPKNDAGIYCGSSGSDVIDCGNGVVQHCKTPTFGNGSCVIDPQDPGYSGCGLLTGLCNKEQSSCDIATSVLEDCQATTSVNTFSDCHVFGGTCGPSLADGGLPNACLTEGTYKPCDATTYRDQCDGDSIASCTYIGTIAHTNCKTIGKSCSATNGTPICVGAQDECTPFSLGVSECTGDTIALCIDGKRTSFDCACAGLVCGADAGIGKTHCQAPP